MIHWIKRSARLVGSLTFFVIFLLSLDYHDPFELTSAGIAFIKASVGASLVWLVAFILADIVFKGIVEDIDLERIDVLDDGLLQRVRDTKRDESIEPADVEKVQKVETVETVEKKQPADTGKK